MSIIRPDLKVLSIYDIHYPDFHRPTIDTISMVAKDYKPDYVIFGGDAYNANGISKFTVKSFEDGVFDTVQEIKGFKKEIYEPLKVICKKAKFAWTLGNHCGQRTTDLLANLKISRRREMYDFIKDKLDVRKYFPDIEFVDYNKNYTIRGLKFTHGEYHAKNHAEKHAIHRGDTHYGHLHTASIFALPQDDYPKIAISSPCACNRNPKYKKNKSTGHINGFLTTDFYKKDYFTLIHIIKNDKLIFNNKLYEA